MCSSNLYLTIERYGLSPSLLEFRHWSNRSRLQHLENAFSAILLTPAKPFLQKLTVLQRVSNKPPHRVTKPAALRYVE